MYSGPELQPEIKDLVDQLETVPFKQLTEYGEGEYGLGQAEYSETKENLMQLLDAYDDSQDLMVE